MINFIGAFFIFLFWRAEDPFGALFFLLFGAGAGAVFWHLFELRAVLSDF